ncbi:probable lipoate-protein ligase [Desulfotalea psychrophila LSv54]|uniref:lipoate--protein ligase n=2 Tax=Desulfotalea psychrophila TaxID=84980 RepID=Q6ALF4_DESPS|nr:probable lipoate-protein ligase [Desulfotalea psychrophila LSv54]
MAMLFIDNSGITDPRLNLAFEEYCLRNLDPQHDYLLLYINEPAVIIGRSQNAFQEIDHAFVRQKEIHVVRRISGGGAVYHDHGNLNFSFITKYEKSNILNFKKITAPVIKALQGLGVPAELSERNNIFAFGMKISGMAQYSTKKSIVSHGTLLFDVEMQDLARALKGKVEQTDSRGVPSVRSRVTNICEHLVGYMDMDTFKNSIQDSIFAPYGGMREKKLTDKDWKDIHLLSKEKYHAWEWNYGKSPECRIRRTARLNDCRIDLDLMVKGGIVKNIKICGDSACGNDMQGLEAVLTGRRYDLDEFKRALCSVDLQCYFWQLTPDKLANCLCGCYPEES